MPTPAGSSAGSPAKVTAARGRPARRGRPVGEPTITARPAAASARTAASPATPAPTTSDGPVAGHGPDGRSRYHVRIATAVTAQPPPVSDSHSA